MGVPGVGSAQPMGGGGGGCTCRIQGGNHCGGGGGLIFWGFVWTTSINVWVSVRDYSTTEKNIFYSQSNKANKSYKTIKLMILKL